MGDESFYEPMPSDVRPKPAASAPPPRSNTVSDAWTSVPQPSSAPARSASDVLFSSMTVKPVATTDPAFVPRTPSKPVGRPHDVQNSSPTSVRPENSSPSRDPKLMASMGIRKEPSALQLTRVNSRRDSDSNANKTGGQDNYTPMLSNMSPKPPASATRALPGEGGPLRFPTPDLDKNRGDGYPKAVIRQALLDIPPFPQEPAPTDPEVAVAQLKSKIDSLPPDRVQALLTVIDGPPKSASSYPTTPPPSPYLHGIHPSLPTSASRNALLALPGSGDSSPVSSPLSGSLTSPLVKDWNREYQHLLSQPDSVSKFERLRDLASDFAYAAETYGRIIISESDLPDTEKTIPPVSMGGRAGGTKYIAQGILFKFALDTEGFYASDEGAIRAAGHELKGVQAYYNTRIPMLKTPLMVLIDYRGFRLTCISLVPIDHTTIKYGSADGGLTVHADIEELNELMREAARKINLKGHIVADKTLYAPGDIEAHLGRDGRFYVVDCARVFPPENPPANLEEMEKGALLFKLLRPEFVQGLLSPLSSDSFSGFQRNDPNIYVHNRETKDATDQLLTECIPSFAYKLDKGFEEAKGIKDFGGFAGRFHRAGINMRFLNLVRHYSVKPMLRRLLLSEAVARVLKNTLREKLREAQRRLRLPLEHPYKDLVINFLNLVIGGTNPGDTEYFWNGPLKQRLLHKFSLVPPNTSEDEPVEQVANLDLRSAVELVHVVRLLVNMAGIIMSDRALSDLAAARNLLDFILIHPDVVGLATKPKQMSIIYEAMDRWLYEKATSESKESSRCMWAMVKQPQHNLKGDAHFFEASGKLLFQYATKAATNRDNPLSHDEVVVLLQSADDKFESASVIDSNSVSMFISWGHLLAFWAQNYADDSQTEALWKRSGEKFQKAIIIGRQRVEDLLADSLNPTGKSFAILFRAAQYSPQLMAIFQQRFSNLSAVNLDGCVTLTDQMLTSLLSEVGDRASAFSIRGCIQVTDASIIPILAKCSRLTSLDLSFSRITEKVFVDLPRLSSINTLSIGGCTELTAKGILAVVRKLPHLTTLVIPNEHSSSLKQIQLALPNAKVRPEAPSKYDLITASPSSDGGRIGVERKGMLQLLKFKSQKWVSQYIILEKDRIALYSDAKTQMASEEILLDGSSVCAIANPTEARAADSAPKGKMVGTVERQFCFRVFAASAKGKTKVPARTRYFCGQSAEERDAWIIAICNNIALYNPKSRSGV